MDEERINFQNRKEASKRIKEGWSTYLEKYSKAIDDMQYKKRHFDNNAEAYQYISHWLPLCLKGNRCLKTMKDHPDAPQGDALELLDALLKKLEYIN
ncbi:MAG: hypothetical protein ACPGUE_03460 [Marinomonas sp.]